MASRGGKTLKEILKESQHLPRVLTFCNIGAPGADTGRWWGRPPRKICKKWKREERKEEKGKERKEGRKKKEKREKEKKERENLSTPQRLRK